MGPSVLRKHSATRVEPMPDILTDFPGWLAALPPWSGNVLSAALGVIGTVGVAAIKVIFVDSRRVRAEDRIAGDNADARFRAQLMKNNADLSEALAAERDSCSRRMDGMEARHARVVQDLYARLNELETRQ